MDLGLSIRQRNTFEANSAPFLVPTLTCRLPYLAWRDSQTWYSAHFSVNRRKPLSIQRRPPSDFHSANKFAPKKCGRCSKRTYPSRITFTRFVEALRKLYSICRFDLGVKSFKRWGKMSSKMALGPSGKDMRSLWTKNSEFEKQSISVGPGTKRISLCRCFSLRVA